MMYTSAFISILAVTSTTQAFPFSNIRAVTANIITRSLSSATSKLSTRQDQCAVWRNISTTLTAQFLADGECTDAARAAIRAAFHDCFNGACDGSLILANECSNSENIGLSRLCGNLANVATQANVGVADLIQFAAAHAIKTCPGGPTVRFKSGRPDSHTPNPVGILPTGHELSSDLLSRFAARGFSPFDLVALIGAHTAAKQRITVPEKANLSMDSTPGVWDKTFYTETLANQAPVTIPSDANLANDDATWRLFMLFKGNESLWNSAFVVAMGKMSMLGVAEGVPLVDCTDVLPGGVRAVDVGRKPVYNWD